MKCKFKNNKVLTALKETGLTITTAEGRTMHKKLASKPIKVQPSKNSDEPRKPTSRCRRCGRFSNGNNCETHKTLMIEKNSSSHTQDEAKCSRTLPTMPSNESVDDNTHTVLTDSHSTDSEETSHAEKITPDTDHSSEMDITTTAGTADRRTDSPTPTLKSSSG